MLSVCPRGGPDPGLRGGPGHGGLHDGVRGEGVCKQEMWKCCNVIFSIHIPAQELDT